VTVQVPKSRNSPSFRTKTVFTFEALEKWLRSLGETFSVADIEVYADQRLIFDNSSFAALDSSVVHRLNLTSLSAEFKSYDKLEKIAPYAKIGGIIDTSSLDDSFPVLKSNTSFNYHYSDVVTHITDLLHTYNTYSTIEMYSRDIISKIWVKAALLTNQYLEYESPALPEGFKKVVVEYETLVRGSRAHGKVDFVIFVQYAILNLLEVKQPALSLEAAEAQALAQMVAARERTLRYYTMQNPHIPASNIETIVNKYASIGLVSTGREWVFMEYKYTERSGVWCAVKSPVFTLTFPTTYANRKELRVQVEQLVTRIAGAALRQHRNAVAQHLEVNRLSSSFEL